MPFSLPLFDLELFHIYVYVIGVNSFLLELSPCFNTSPVLWDSWQLVVTLVIRVVAGVIRVRAPLHPPPTQVALPHLRA